MKYLKLFESYTIDNHSCAECGWSGNINTVSKPSAIGITNDTGFIPVGMWTDNVIICPQCKTENDVWQEGENEPLRHKIKTFIAYLSSISKI